MILSDRQDSHLLPIVYETTALLMSYEVAPASLLGKMEPAAGGAKRNDRPQVGPQGECECTSQSHRPETDLQGRRVASLHLTGMVGGTGFAPATGVMPTGF